MTGRSLRQISSRAVPSFLREGAALVDVRRPEEWQQTGIVAGSILLTFYDAQGGSRPQQWLKELDRRVPCEQPLLLICRSGYRTGLVGEFLLENSTRELVYNVADGIYGWLAAGLPVAAYPGSGA